MPYDLLPPSFWPLALAHFLALISPGPDFMLVVSHSVRHRLRGSVFICLGIAAGNAIYIGLALLGWAGVRDNPTIYRLLGLAGAVYLGWLGMKLLKTPQHDLETDANGDESKPWHIQFGLGLGSATLNPKNMVFYLSIMTALLAADSTSVQRVAAGIWMCLAVLLWDVFIAATIARPTVRRIVGTKAHVVERLCGMLLLCIALSMLYVHWR